MSDPLADGRKLAAGLAPLSEEERAEISANNVTASQREHAAFQAAYRAGGCYMCNRRLDHFATTKPCLHWLFRPQDIKKKYIAEALTKYGANRTQTYLRWVASEDAPVRNINDLPSDEGRPKIIEVTIRYREFEWSFSCSENDLAGHSKTKFPISIFKCASMARGLSATMISIFRYNAMKRPSM